MLEYEWENSALLEEAENRTTEEDDQNSHVLREFTSRSFYAVVHNPPAETTFNEHANSHRLLRAPLQDPYAAGSTIFSADPGPSYFLIPKTEMVNSCDFTARIGLDLGGRTYFSSAEDDDLVNRLYRRSQVTELSSSSTPKCQVECCQADLTDAKHYHRRHKVCDFHSKAPMVVASGLNQRFCQQCSRFHMLSEFDNGKRSCRKRLADHNRRRRKSHLRNDEKRMGEVKKVLDLASETLTA